MPCGAFSPLLPSRPKLAKLGSMEEQLVALKDMQKGILVIQQEVGVGLSSDMAAKGVARIDNT